jgi:hypothetical protein
MPYHYKAFGLSIVSTIELPELTLNRESEQSRQPEIEVVEGEIEARLDSPMTSGLFYQASQTDCLLTAPEGSRYWLHLGQKVVISRNRSSSDETVRYFLIYGALPMLLIQRGIFLLHGSAVSDGQRALVLLGASQSGKSTLATGLWQRGWRLVSDELIVCTLDAAQRVCLQPGIPQILLWRNAFEQLNLDHSLAKPTRVPNQFIKSADEKFEDKPVPVQTVFCLERISGESTQTEVQGRPKFFRILQEVCLPRFPRPQTINAKQAQVPMILAAQTFLETIPWSSQQCRANDLVDKILERLK